MRIEHHTAAGAVRAGSLDGSLKPRIVGLAESLSGPSWLAVLIESGSVRIAGEDAAVSAPVLAWRPWLGGARATFRPGTAGTYVILGPTALANAVGHMPESRELRDMADRPVTAPLLRAGASLPPLRAAFEALRRELETGGVAARAVVEAYLRVILVEVYRAGRAGLTGARPAPPSRRVFAEFGALVEAHFRERWSVNGYAAALNVSRDRLGDVCRRVRGLGPKALIDRRTALEARLQLENSSDSIEQVAGSLGFSSASQFNRFFRRTVGSPPGTYRAAFLKGARSGASDPARPYEWP